MKKLLGSAALFASTSTLLCCALPALFVALGAGSVFASLVGYLPQLVWLSENKAVTFGVAGALLGASGFSLWRARLEPCPLDPVLAEACKSTRRWSLRVFWTSAALFAVGSFFAFAPQVLGWA